MRRRTIVGAGCELMNLAAAFTVPAAASEFITHYCGFTVMKVQVNKLIKLEKSRESESFGRKFAGRVAEGKGGGEEGRAGELRGEAATRGGASRRKIKRVR